MKKIVKLTDRPNACDNLTNFEQKSKFPQNGSRCDFFLNVLGKSREMTSMELILWRVLAIWNHCD